MYCQAGKLAISASNGGRLGTQKPSDYRTLPTERISYERAFRTSQKALLLEFSSQLSIANAREIFQGKRGTVLAAKGSMADFFRSSI
jgi:hypothetical protein